MLRSFLTPLAFLLFAAVTTTSCDEIGPVLNLQDPTDTTAVSTLETQLRGVLIEEFTGVRCVNCPAGAEAIQQLRDIHGERLVPISLHTGFFANPYNESRYDFQTADADAIEVLIGGPQGYPSAVIDRKLFDGEQGLQLSRNSWAGYIGLQLAEEPRVAIGIEPTFNGDSRELNVNVELLGRAGTDGREALITVLLLESEILDYQLTPEGKESEYSHEHALRQAITAPTGQSVGAITAGQSISLDFEVDVAEDYNEEHLEVVAFVHYGDLNAGGKEVLQAVGVEVD